MICMRIAPRQPRCEQTSYVSVGIVKITAMQKEHGEFENVQRARRILEELRRRFGENFRLQLELDYIERLLHDY